MRGQGRGSVRDQGRGPVCDQGRGSAIGIQVQYGQTLTACLGQGAKPSACAWYPWPLVAAGPARLQGPAPVLPTLALGRILAPSHPLTH